MSGIRTVFARVFGVFLLAITIVLSINSLLMVTSFREQLKLRQEADMIIFTEDIADSASYFLDSTADSDAIRRALSQNKPLRDLFYSATQRYDSTIWVIDGMGNLLQIESDTSPRWDDDLQRQNKLSNIAYQTLCQAIRQGETITLEGTLEGWFDTPMLSISAPIRKGDVILGAVVTHVSAVKLDDALRTVGVAALRIFVIAVLLGAILAFMLSRYITNPIRALREASVRVAQHQFGDPVPVTSEDEIGQLVKAFNDMAGKIRLHEETQGDFVANVSHELRSPITSIQGFAQGMLDGTIPQEEHPRYLTIINDESRRLTKLIKDLLDLSKIEAGNFPLRLTDFELNELTRRVLIRYADKGEARNLDMDVDFRQDFCWCHGDTDRIEQVLVNLVDNAIKYTPENGSISIWTHGTEKGVLFSITNSGPGIPQEDIPYLFERFYKADKAHTDKTSTGLGLAIVKRIVDQHGGTITVRSVQGKETVFLLELPAGIPVPAPTEPPMDAEYVPDAPPIILPETTDRKE